MSLDQHHRVVGGDGGDVASPLSASPAEAIAEGLASVRLEGLEPDAAGLGVLDDVAAGRLSIDQALARVLSAARAA